jgi:hypothetical protein
LNRPFEIGELDLGSRARRTGGACRGNRRVCLPYRVHCVRIPRFPVPLPGPVRSAPSGPIVVASSEESPFSPRPQPDRGRFRAAAHQSGWASQTQAAAGNRGIIGPSGRSECIERSINVARGHPAPTCICKTGGVADQVRRKIFFGVTALLSNLDRGQVQSCLHCKSAH